MIYIIIVAVLVSAVIILFLRGDSPDVPYQGGEHTPSMHRLGERPDAKSQEESISVEPRHLEALQQLRRETLEAFCRKLIKNTGLIFKSIDYHQQHGFHILSYFDKPILRGHIIILGILAGPSGIISSSEVIGFSDMVKAERAMKGVLVTNGFFSEEVMKLNEGASVELIDRAQLASLMEKLAPELIPRNP